MERSQRRPALFGHISALHPPRMANLTLRPSVHRSRSLSRISMLRRRPHAAQWSLGAPVLGVRASAEPLTSTTTRIGVCSLFQKTGNDKSLVDYSAKCALLYAPGSTIPIDIHHRHALTCDLRIPNPAWFRDSTDLFFHFFLSQPGEKHAFIPPRRAYFSTAPLHKQTCAADQAQVRGGR